jgi:hypothetical protein
VEGGRQLFPLTPILKKEKYKTTLMWFFAFSFQIFKLNFLIIAAILKAKITIK